MEEERRYIVCMVSDHGFGHAARSSLIIKQLLFSLHQNVILISSVPGWFIHERILSGETPAAKQFIHYQHKVDVGVYQTDSVTIDVAKTLLELENFWERKKENVNEIVEYLSQYSISVVYSDVTALAAFVARKLRKRPHYAHLPLIGGSNFTWDWIYSQLIPPSPDNDDNRRALQRYVRIHEEANRSFDEFIIMPFSNADYFATLPFRKQTQISGLFASPQPMQRKMEVNDWLKSLLPPSLDADRRSKMKFILYSFGGFVFPVLSYMKLWKIPDDWTVIWIDSDRSHLSNDKAIASDIDNVLIIDEFELTQFQYIDVLSAVDIAVIKTGFGVVSEVIANEISTLYVDRPGFSEHKELVKVLHQNVSAKEVPLQDVLMANLFETNHVVDVYPNRVTSQMKENAISQITDLLCSYV